ALYSFALGFPLNMVVESPTSKPSKANRGWTWGQWGYSGLSLGFDIGCLRVLKKVPRLVEGVGAIKPCIDGVLGIIFGAGIFITSDKETSDKLSLAGSVIGALPQIGALLKLLKESFPLSQVALVAIDGLSGLANFAIGIAGLSENDSGQS